jgi:hypothetical protein
VMEEHVGGRRSRSMGRQPRKMKEAASSVLQRFLAVDSGSAAGLVWLRGAQKRCAVVSASAHGAEEHGERHSRATSA